MTDDDRGAFPRASNVASREEVREHLGDKEFVKSVAKCGPGLTVTHRAEQYRHCTFTSLLENRGWYVASYNVQEMGDSIVLMPLQEVEQP